MTQKITGQMAHKNFEYNCVMTKKEKEQLKLNNLLHECIGEQLKIGLHPADNISIYIYKDPETGVVCPREALGYAVIYKDSPKKIILIRRNCFEKYPTNELKRLIHHELIHLNLKDDGNIINHIKDWKQFTELSNKIYKVYGINPLEKYSISCYKSKNSSPEYNCSSICPRCGLKSHYNIDENIEYDYNLNCSNCGHKMIIEKG